jgi:tRNA-uridine 2-sulfurtransferase
MKAGNLTPGATVAVGLSGGIDSAVAAASLVSDGFRVIGLTARMTAAVSRCCSDADTLRAAQVCDRLGIPHHIVDVGDAFARHVVAYFGDTYVAGETPSPCVVCNREIKFGALLRQAQSMGAAALATGHYVRKADAGGGHPALLRGVDATKDQSYFLACLTTDQLRAAVFPLGGRYKADILRCAATRGLVARPGRESQDLCFVTEGTHGAWLDLRRLVTPPPGEMVDSDGHVVGRHVGLHHYTIGQRRGLGIALGYPAYVIRIEAAANRVVVGPHEAALASRMYVRDMAWQAVMVSGRAFRCAVQIRYNHAAAPAAVAWMGATGMEVVFDAPQFAIAPGQLAAFYDGDRVLGAGWIAAAGDRAASSVGP